ncbi:iron complex transport system substrate-binding protein [Prescottella agglutinans]|uniref:Iron complex transport system substrate-binding protein n=1 Tax=Prescottella agglutinans TaxID=1644129 RepID=A0ABT6MCQ9_9NOCA|nr:iron-siderophore ABC transporter substrate-binding protein [Prescottella agglutinans]MDH6282087.1 iron complex transport system substrate-binding protein [Prescottella agglutinans]
MSRTSRRALASFAAVGVAVGLALTGCPSTGTTTDIDETTSAEADGFPRTVEHFRGVANIDTQPQRIVTLDNSYADAVLLLESPLAGYVDYREQGLPDYLGDARAAYAADAVSVGKVSNASLEKVAELQPDLILSAEVRDGKNYEALSALAPTVFSQSTGPTWKENIRLVARALGKEDLAEQKIGEYEARARAIGDEINAKADNPTISVVRFAGEPTARLYRTTSFSGIVLADAGLARPDSQGPDPADAGSIMNAISPERINDADADVIFVATYKDPAGKSLDAAQAFLQNPLWGTLKGRTVDVDDAMWMTPVSIQGAHKILDDLAQTFGVDPHNS